MMRRKPSLLQLVQKWAAAKLGLALSKSLRSRSDILHHPFGECLERRTRPERPLGLSEELPLAPARQRPKRLCRLLKLLPVDFQVEVERRIVRRRPDIQTEKFART